MLNFKKNKAKPIFTEPEFYRKHSKIQYNIASGLIETLKLTGKENILDVGCGDGLITFLVSKKLSTGHITGIDISKEMVFYAQKTYKDNKNCTFIQGNIEEYVSKETYDIIISFNSLHWVPKQSTALKNIFISLKPGGRILFNLFPGHDSSSRLNKIIYERMLSNKWTNYFKDFNGHTAMPTITSEKYALLLKAAGFKANCKYVAVNRKYTKNKSEIIDTFLAFLPAAKVLPKNMQRTFVTEVINKLIPSRNIKKIKTKPVSKPAFKPASKPASKPIIYYVVEGIKPGLNT